MSDIPSRDRIEAHTVMQKLRQMQKEIDEIPGGGEGGEKYTAGEGISIVKGVISNSDHSTTTANTARLGTLADSIANLEDADTAIEADISKLKTEDASIKSALNGKQDVLTAGANITIENNVISAVGGQAGTTYQAGDGISIEGDVISNTDHADVLQLNSSYATMLQDILRLGNRVTNAETDADSALTRATNAVSTANSANSRALSAANTANTALTKASNLKLKFTKVEGLPSTKPEDITDIYYLTYTVKFNRTSTASPTKILIYAYGDYWITPGTADQTYSFITEGSYYQASPVATVYNDIAIVLGNFVWDSTKRLAEPAANMQFIDRSTGNFVTLDGTTTITFDLYKVTVE